MSRAEVSDVDFAEGRQEGETQSVHLTLTEGALSAIRYEADGALDEHLQAILFDGLGEATDWIDEQDRRWSQWFHPAGPIRLARIDSVDDMVVVFRKTSVSMSWD